MGDERKMYHLIALRFIAAFYPDCLFSTTTILGESGGIKFKATGKVITSAGWRAIFQGEPTDRQGDDDAILPQMTAGEHGPHTPSAIKKTTQPPKPYTEGTLLRAMETAGKTVDDESLREAMKENGIGRPSTRAAIIETLFKRRYIYRERKNIMASQAGIDLIDTINEELLKSAKLTGLWENKLRQIERGIYPPSQFIDELKSLIGNIVVNVLSDNSLHRIDVEAEKKDEAKTSRGKKKAGTDGKAKPKPTASPRRKKKAVSTLEDIKCPKCGKGHLLKGRSAYGCSRYADGCDMLLPFTEYPAELDAAGLQEMINAKL